MSLRGRVSKLEENSGRVCPACSTDPNAPVRYIITWGDDDEAPEVSSPACPRCGYRSQTVLGWDGVVTDLDAARAEREHRRKLEADRAEYLRSRPDLTGQQEFPDCVPPEWGEG